MPFDKETSYINGAVSAMDCSADECLIRLLVAVAEEGEEEECLLTLISLLLKDRAYRKYSQFFGSSTSKWQRAIGGNGHWNDQISRQRIEAPLADAAAAEKSGRSGERANQSYGFVRVSAASGSKAAAAKR